MNQQPQPYRRRIVEEWFEPQPEGVHEDADLGDPDDEDEPRDFDDEDE